MKRFLALASTVSLFGLAWPGRLAHAGSETLRVCDDVKGILTLDPFREFSEKNHVVIQQIFDGLVRFDADGRIEPALAASWRWIDDRTMEFSIRPGVEFHNGEPLTAEAVKFSIERFAAANGGFPGAGFLDSIAGVEVVDPATIRVKTRFPDGVLLHRLAGLVTVAPPRYIAERGEDYFASHPVGTGAFRFVRWDASELVLAANERYWLKGYPKFKGLVFRFIPVKEQVEGLLDGTVDIVTELPGTETFRVVQSGKAKVVKKESFYTAGSSINISTGPLADRRVRQALNYAIDKEALVRYDLMGNGKPSATLTMSGEPGHNPKLKPYPYDPGRARRLLKEAGYPDGLRLRVVVKAQGERTMKIISNQLKKVGILLDISTTTDATVIHDIQSQPWDLTFGNCADPMSHSFFVQSIFIYSRSPFSITKDPRYDELLGRMVSTLDPAEQQKRGEELDQYIYDEALSIFTYKRIRTYGVRKGIEFVPSVTGMPYFFAADHVEPGAR